MSDESPTVEDKLEELKAEVRRLRGVVGCEDCREIELANRERLRVHRATCQRCEEEL